MTGEAVARIRSAQKSARDSWPPLERLASTFNDVNDDDFRALVKRVAVAMDDLDRYFVLLLMEARRRGVG
ncbi:hypothetical protein ACG83_26110 [Frankia sp. R43]|nr:hypothetical protein ACG83_26110 [Frankia sp. R43]